MVISEVNMYFLDFFLSRKKNTANIAKKRLQIIIAEERQNYEKPDYFPKLKKELLIVIAKYVKIEPDTLTIQLSQKDNDISILEVNINVPE